MKKSKSKSKQTKKKKAVRKTQKKKSISKVQNKPVSDAIVEDDEIAEAKIQQSIGQEDDFLDLQIDHGDDDDEEDEDYSGENYGTQSNF